MTMTAATSPPRACDLLKPFGPQVATGRLGKIYKAMDPISGRLFGLEVVKMERLEQVLSLQWQFEQEFASLQMLQQSHLVRYEKLVVDAQRKEIQVITEAISGGTLAKLLREFGWFHPSVVRRYIQAIVTALVVLHEANVSLGGLSTVTLFLRDGVIKVGNFFPSLGTTRFLFEHNVLVEHHIAQSYVARNPIGRDPFLQDFRSIAFLLVEMITGQRVCGQAMGKANLLKKLSQDHLHIEKSFVEHLFALCDQECSALERLHYLKLHEYLQLLEPAQSRRLVAEFEQRQLVYRLIQEELSACYDSRSRHMHDICAWSEHFEQKHAGRKPKVNERPQNIVRLQYKCTTIGERICQLEQRMKLLQSKSWDGGHHPIDTESNVQKQRRTSSNNGPEPVPASDASDASELLESVGARVAKAKRQSSREWINSAVAPLQIQPSSNERQCSSGESGESDAEAAEAAAIEAAAMDGERKKKRSPAQKAFLKRFSID